MYYIIVECHCRSIECHLRAKPCVSVFSRVPWNDSHIPCNVSCHHSAIYTYVELSFVSRVGEAFGARHTDLVSDGEVVRGTLRTTSARPYGVAELYV